jgi:hypothetical protein
MKPCWLEILQDFDPEQEEKNRPLWRVQQMNLD